MKASNKNIRTINIIYWIATTIFVLFDGVGAIGFNTQPAVEGIRHMGFPDYFRVELGIGKIIGGILLIIPAMPKRFKEWAYVGFGISCISAAIGHVVIGDPVSYTLMPLVVFAILAISYIFYYKRLQAKQYLASYQSSAQWQHQTILTQ